jgi:hypothetical protein
MKKLLSVTMAYVMALSFFSAPFLHGACVPPLTLQAPGGYPYMQSFDTGTNNSCFIYILDKSGNLSISGNETVLGNSTTSGASSTSGTTIYPPTGATNISSTTIILPTATFMTLSSSAGVVTCGLGLGSGGTAAPCISTSTAINGQFLILGATQSVNVVMLTSGTSSGMDLGASTRTITWGKTETLIYNSVLSLWTEISYGNN